MWVLIYLSLNLSPMGVLYGTPTYQTFNSESACQTVGKATVDLYLKTRGNSTSRLLGKFQCVKVENK